MHELLTDIRAESIRPWKLATLGVGLGLLIAGSYLTPAPDWDIPVSFIMALPTYATAGWSMRVMVKRRWRDWPLMALWTWLCVDGLYAAYWSFVDPQALDFMRSVNWPASLCLYWMCGLVWYWRGSMAELWLRVRQQWGHHDVPR